MRVLVTFAVEAEFAPWRKFRKFRFIDYMGLLLWRTDFGNIEITVLLTGMGEQAASRAMDLMLGMADEEKYFDICISSGLAGALQELLTPGDIIAPRTVRTAFRHADAQFDSLAVNEQLLKLALSLGAKATECLFTTDQVLLTAKQKQECGCSSKAQSVDMESFEIVKEACAWGAQSVVVRAVSDAAGEDLPIDFNLTMSKESQISVSKVVAQLLKHPLALPALLRFGRQSHRAAEGLVNFLELYVGKLSEVHFESAAGKVTAQ
jgi:adenosylhomocysteine nucleosidase